MSPYFEDHGPGCTRHKGSNNTEDLQFESRTFWGVEVVGDYEKCKYKSGCSYWSHCRLTNTSLPQCWCSPDPNTAAAAQLMGTPLPPPPPPTQQPPSSRTEASPTAMGGCTDTDTVAMFTKPRTGIWAFCFVFRTFQNLYLSTRIFTPILIAVRHKSISSEVSFLQDVHWQVTRWNLTEDIFIPSIHWPPLSWEDM